MKMEKKMNKLLVPILCADDWKKLLAYTEKQWGLFMLKTVILILLSFCVSINSFGNVAVFGGYGSNIELKSNADIQMVSEDINITILRSGQYSTGGAKWFSQNKARYNCKFKLKNLSDKEIIVQVGFPLSSTENAYLFSKKNELYQAETISRFNFIAGTKKGTYPIKFYPYDKKRKYSLIFLWDMKFKPHETIDLLVTYTMSGCHGLGSTRKRPYTWKPYKHDYLGLLEYGVSVIFAYVTETGKSWAGNIEKAVFTINDYEFDNMITKRGLFETTELDPYYEKKKNDYKDWGNKILKRIEPTGWNKVLKNRKPVIRWEYTNYVPEKNIEIMYLQTAVPANINQFNFLLKKIKKQNERYNQSLNSRKPKVLSKSDIRNIADAILEFYGVKTNNPEIKEFLSNQFWYTHGTNLKIDNEYKKFLLNKSKPLSSKQAKTKCLTNIN